jgi:hypothetical protein
MASSVPDARAALYTGLTGLQGAAEPLEGVGVYRTGLWRDVSARDRIIIGNARDVQREVAALARPAPFREQFELLIQFEVYRRGDDIGFVEDRLWELITAVEQHVMADPTLNGSVSQCLPGGVDEQAGPSQQDEDTVISMATLRLECWARVLLN